MTSPSSASVRRINKEFADLQENPISNLRCSLANENLYQWNCAVAGPRDSVYVGGTFHFTLAFRPDYPFQPPTAQFTTRIYHPNFDSEGNICLPILRPQVFKPSVKLRSILEQVIHLLIEPNPDDPLSPSVAEQYNNDRPAFEKIARDYVQQFAKS
ncbi:ubiquitin conjugating enzyme E2 for HECT-type and RBR family E3 Ub ligase, Ubc14 [Schizosaccharomyces osmophilus]|uniref:E2 ubiquitin-conjugating enzyme n=1 Tax=Schizosaccharomyces osmophilus TaxID=2545709 RepID=A0AAE9WE42_9SCHI|nr:ubiquitin conjugating enzyme E2 for HECT-type and RBR family E3 Ub ligase, Ubc14 [Schizosaccharomyces osmophilus]WBW73959.1 ubiquitin conjugating enzyme E2 for HECT-type and RBR family E3 Ub ligase, Ubc14 [Schizosaccharomyces osmophilus]